MLLFSWASYSKLGSFFSLMIMTGIVLGFVSAALLLPKPTDSLCTAFPWVLGIAFILVYGCLFIKTWAFYQVWRSASQYKRANLSAAYLLKVVGAALLAEIIFLIIWTVVDPPKVHKHKVQNNEEEYECSTKHPTFWIIFAVVKGIWLAFGAGLSVLTRNIVKEYNESSSIAYAIYSNVLVLIIAIPLAILIDGVAGGRMIVEVIVIVAAFTLTTVIMFFSIWRRILVSKTQVQMVAGGATATTRGKSSTNSTRSGAASSSAE